MKARNSEIEGARFFLSATVLQYHLMAAYWKDMHDKSGWLAVNGFFVISAILAATSLESSWNRWQTRKASLQIEDATEKWMQKMSDAPTVSHDGTKVWFKRSLVTRFLCQYFDFLITRIPPFLWIAWANIIVLSPYDPLPVWRRMFDPAAFPLTNYWGLGLQGDGKHHNYYVPNPVFWYLCSLVLFLLGAPIFFHIFRVLKKVPLPVYFKGVVFFTLPFAICVLDYYAIRALSFPDLMSSPEHEAAGHVLRYSPYASVGKCVAAMVAGILWSEWKEFPHWLSRIPVIDLLVLSQVIWLVVVEPHPWFDARWILFYKSAFTPGHCLIFWAMLQGVGCYGPIRQTLGSRYLRKVSHGCSLFVFLLHMPMHLCLFGGLGSNGTGTVCSTVCSYILATHLQDGQNKLLHHHGRLTAKLLRSLRRA
eukprot:Blabericola_migrator_1__2942@NODE_1848_length_3675_cov_272_488636_g1166_i1_p2_GENE_NODE_1848_length_3675_cov_272_488636_g1166_i1NODE_1848_length_3675_cov_272_488636_g1166_i1_p2_ORF_typecomplete_len421_score31_24Acyl_transf_3/PF01757_22/6_2e11DUF5509/PF17625_2/0_18DUF2173/PF09941_9/0_25DUF1275/PF06912_11/4_9e02DUF1275/PF06912_11/0_24_NODE_1848_length_3675_cov_272_488636_g1166_i12581520